jgi:hypothetical protein
MTDCGTEWAWMTGCGELLGCAVIDKFSVHQPVNGALLGTSIPEGAPHRDQVGVMVLDLGLAASERSRLPQ